MYLRWGACIPILQEACSHVVVALALCNGVVNGFALPGLESVEFRATEGPSQD
jgi:hypothetical protein